MGIPRPSLLIAFFVLLLIPLSIAEEAYDDAFDFGDLEIEQRLEEKFAAAIAVLNEGRYKVAVKRLKELAVEGHAKSQHMVGSFYRYGMGVRQNSKRAAQWFKLSSEQDYPMAMLAFAEACLEGEGTKKDVQQAVKLLEPVAAQNWSFATSVEDFGLIRATRARAAYLLGSLYSEGEAVERDFEKARQLMRQASLGGDVSASMYLAIEYAKGEVVERSLEESKRYFELVDLQSFDEARRALRSAAMEHVDAAVQADLEKAAEWLNQTFSRAILKSQTNFAKSVLKKDSEDFNPVFAASLLKMAAEGGYAEAEHLVGYLHCVGEGVAVDFKEAGLWLKRAAEQGSTGAKYNLAVLHLRGELEESSDQEAELLLSEAADLGMYCAQLLLDGDFEPDFVTDERDLELIGPAEEAGDVRAAFAAARRAERGWLVDYQSNERKRYRAYLSLANQGYFRAEYRVGLALSTGAGVKQNVKKAVEYLEKAAAADHGGALFELAYLLEESSAIDNDFARAAAYYQRAVDGRSPGAANNLAILYANGRGVDKDRGKAFELYKVAAEEGDVFACYNLGNAYRDGKGVEKDRDLAIEWFTQSAEKGYLNAARKLVELHEQVEGEIDAAELTYWVEKAAELGDVDAMKRIAIYYDKGIGVPHSQIKAMFWITNYLNLKRGTYIINNALKNSEPASAMSRIFPTDYEAMLLYVDLLLDDSWPGYDYDTAFDILEALSKVGFFEARFRLAKMHANELVKKSKPKKGRTILEDVYKDSVADSRYSAHAGKSAFFISRMYKLGKGVMRDDALAAEWMKRAADAGLPHARCSYAVLQVGGIGVPQDHDAGVATLIELAQRGFFMAAMSLGELLKDGLVEPRHLDAVKGPLIKLAENGYEEAADVLDHFGVEYHRKRLPSEDGRPQDKPPTTPARGPIDIS